MKKTIVLFSIIMLSGLMMFAQPGKGKMEVLYFKANLCACKAKTCSLVGAEIQNIISKNFADGSVVFREVALADEANKPLVEKYNAQSQTLVLLKTSRNKEVGMDITDLVKAYSESGNQAFLEAGLLANIKDFKKKK